MKKVRFLLMAFILVLAIKSEAQEIFVEAESFQDKGGWVIDQQSMDQMGSPYLMAHGYGLPVKDAVTTINVSRKGKYRVWVRTRNWVAPWNVTEAPGLFQLSINKKLLNTTFGTEGKEWHWQDGGTVSLNAGPVEIVLQDLTGFNGRCDAIYLTTNTKILPPDGGTELLAFRRDKSGLPKQVEDAGIYDLVVVGGGMAGICAAVSAARLGCKVALVQDRPVLGGNNSSEVRVGLSGLIFQQPYPKLGNLVDEIGSVGHWTLWEAKQDTNSERSKRILSVIEKNPEKKIHNAGPQSNYGDEKKQMIVESEPNLKLFLNTRVFATEKQGDKIVSVIGRNIETGHEIKLRGTLYADCTGDANLGYLAGADYREGRESKAETGEPRSPEVSDNQVMGTSVQWYAQEKGFAVPFPECPWAVSFTDETCQKIIRGDWDWETGIGRNHVTDIEYIRDYGLRTVFGNWSFLKNKSVDKAKYANLELAWVAYIGGKRESRRIMGDIILKEQDILNQVPYPDASFTTTWGVDLHYPKLIKGFIEEPFLSWADIKEVKPYAVPYRCLYSRNVDNLFMAGRNISVTHVALGTVRVMRTTGMMGEVLGMAASICKKHDALPRDVYEKYLAELKVLMDKGIEQKTHN